MHRPSMVARSRLRLDNQGVLPTAVVRHKCRDQPADDGGNPPVAPVGLGSQERPDARRVLEGHPHAGVHGTLLVQRQEFTQQC